MTRFLIPLFLFCFVTSSAYGQSNSTGTSGEITIEKRLLPYTNPLTQSEVQQEAVIVREPMDDLNQEILGRISEIYKIHIQAIDAVIASDALEAENSILSSISALQALMEDYPEIYETNNRFRELYRTVMAEHREFYGYTEPANQFEGEIFQLQDVLFAESGDAMLEDYTLPENITTTATQVPLTQNNFVNRQVNRFRYDTDLQDIMERWLQRSEQYFPMMREIFREEGTPEELIHMSLIESGLNPTARSRAGAVGMWQFMPATGRASGLEINFWVDERQDPVKATRAAARHLKELYELRNDWHLAIASYNISPRGLNRAINSAGGSANYWDAIPYLPRETQAYVPLYIATSIVAMDPETFGFERSYGGERWTYDVVNVDGLMPLDKLAEAAGITTQELKGYNPELLRLSTPPGDSYPLKIPAARTEEFMALYEEIPRDERVGDMVMHTVSRGESLSTIAGSYGTTVATLMAHNEGLRTTIYPNQTIIVPVAAGSTTQTQPSNSAIVSSVSSSSYTAPAPSNTSAMAYRVKRGDTVGHIAEWFDVRASEIRAWNGTGDSIRPDQRLTLYVNPARTSYYSQIDAMTFSQKQEAERLQRQGVDIYSRQFVNGAVASNSGAVSYTVRRNDTLSTIAQSFGVSVSAIQRLNNLNGTVIYAGQTLRIQ